MKVASGLEPLCALGIFKAGLNTNYWLKKQAFCSKLDHQRDTPYVGVKNQNCHENQPPKIRPKNKKVNLFY
jgi:hypothetical protein